ncbi:GTP-binding protein gtr2 [Teratosphaeria destructans]|uniref:GTP-binding protein n=1 Tax=Teratosphaeria destructans TaxID=418781 RepID=A0A9W7SPH6_9PEZI|nr:GTP-binding protein gtr2 [Teratosphaeria destructans]
MRTLFGENILSPPIPSPPQRNPFELAFGSNASHTNSTVSSQSSPAKRDWLTHHYQTQRRDLGESTDSFDHACNGRHTRQTRRKGNPKLLFMGLRRHVNSAVAPQLSGKSSIQKVIFQKLSPADTLFLEPTSRIEWKQTKSFITFETGEVPAHLYGQLDSNADLRTIFPDAGAVIWVIDVQDEYLPSITEMVHVIVFLAEHHPRVNFEVFIHKTDGLSDEYKYDTFREVRQRVYDELSDLGHGDRSISYHQTNIFDHSIYEAMSRVVQRLLPQLPAMEALLNKLCSTCRIQKAYLFDTVSKIYVATDASPAFMRDYEACSDYVDVIVDIKQIYGWQKAGSDQSSHSDADEDNMGESMVTFDKSGDTYIYAREINEYLSLVCVMGKGSSADKRVLIDYNVTTLQEALLKIFKV